MQPLSLIVAIASGVLAKIGMDQVLKKSPALASLNEKLKHVYGQHTAEIRAALKKKFNPAAVDVFCGVLSTEHLSEKDIAHLKEEDPRLYREFLQIVSRYDPEIAPLAKRVRDDLTTS